MIAIFGPTGVGKTEVAIEVAEMLRARGERPVAVSADAIQVYEGLETLSAKPSPEQLERLEHRLVGYVPIDSEYSVAQYAAAAHAEIDDLLDGGRDADRRGGDRPLSARCAHGPRPASPRPPAGLRERLEEELATLGAGALHERLRPRRRRRCTRGTASGSCARSSSRRWGGALPDIRSAVVGEPSPSRAARRPDHGPLGAVAAHQPPRPRDAGRPGACREVESALEAGASRTARKALGFREIAAHLAGEIETEETRGLLERRHLSYVKRQLTWMRKLAGVEVIDRTTLDATEAAGAITARH